MSSAKILLIENDLTLQSSLLRFFKQQDWQTGTATSLEEAWTLLDSQSFDLAVIDRVLDDGDGLEIVEYLRKVQHPMMMLCLTEKGSVMERLKGLQLGADDYLPKPFSSQELLLRIKNLLGKYKSYKNSYLVCDALELDPQTGQVRTPSTKFFLRRRESQILTCLLRHKKTVVTRQMLVDAIWPGSTKIPEDSTLDVYVRRLRIGLGKYGSSIKTVRGFGYMLSP